MKIKVNFKSLMLLFFFTALSSFAFAQRTLSGMVTDADSNEPLVGASVVITGTTKGTLTDIDGKYTLSDVPKDATTITVSFTGYANLTVPIGSSNVIDVKLKGGSILEEVVVVGYGTVKKSDATGAVTAISEKDFNKGVITSPEQLLQGRAAGVQITQNGGEPGGGINIRVRGTSSVNGGNNPLYVIDGVPLSSDNSTPDGNSPGLGSSSPRNPLNFINPNDIEKIDVLKDASATAIYGARGANGVVLITTKRGKKGAGTLDYTYSLGASKITKKYDLLSADEFAKAVPASNLGGKTDWQDVVLQTGLTNNHNVSYGGGSDKGSYRFSFGYMDQEGIFKQSGFKRYSARFNGDQKFLDDKLTVGVNVTAANTADRAVPITNNSGFGGDLLARMLISNPTLSIYKNRNSTTLDCDTCEINQPSSNSEANPAAILRYTKDFTNTLRVNGNVFAEYKLADGLSFRTVLGFDKSQSQRRSATSPLLNNDNNKTIGGSARMSNINLDNSLWDSYLTYTKKFGDIDFTGLLGYSYQSFLRSGDYASYQGFTAAEYQNNLDLLINNAASATGSSVNNSFKEFDELQSQFARINLGYQDKYLLTASVRRDGSTRFAPDKKYGVFPSFAFKWRLIQEAFVPKNIFSDLGLRIGYGITGNQDFAHNIYTQRSRYVDGGINNNNQQTNGGYFLVTTQNYDLQWESTKQTNFGLDFGFLNNRLTGSIDYYEKHTDKLLFKVEGDGSYTQSGLWQNLSTDIQNKGVELSLNFVAVDNKDFRWNINTNISNNKSLVKSLAGGVINTGAINGQGLSGAFAQQIIAGQPLGAYFIRRADGFDANGLSKYVDGNDAQVLVGKSGLPTLTAGLTNSFSYKGVDLSLFFNGVFGNYIYNNTANAFFTQGSLQSGRNTTKNVVGNGESATNAPEPSTRFLEKGDFVRLANLSLGYNLPIKSNKIKGVRLFVSGQNILTFTSYTGQDPEVNTNKAINGVVSYGIDYTAYPRAKTWTLGANVSF